MKTQIIQLEVHDDTISVKDKMDWSQTPRVLLVWPQRGKVLQNQLDLVLLERYSSSHGSQLALLTQDPEVIFQASNVGIPVFQSRETAQLHPWRKSFREFKRRELLENTDKSTDLDLLKKSDKEIQPELPAWARISIFVIGVLAVLAIAGILLPSASIMIQAEKNQNSLDIPIRAILGEEQVQISGQIPVRELNLTVESNQFVPATGSVMIPSEYAQGEVVFTNLGEEPITIPAKTILKTGSENPVQFLTDQPGSLSPGFGETIPVPITALKPGISGNVGSDQISLISSLLGEEVAVTNPFPLTGGDDLSVPAPNLTDQRRLERNLLIDLKGQADEELQSILNQDDILLTVDLNDYQVIEETFLPEEGSAGNKLEGYQKVRFIILYTSVEDLNALAENLVIAQYQESDFHPILDSITVKHLSTPISGPGSSFTWQIEINWEDQRVLQHNEVIQTILGKPPADAVNLLQEKFNLVDPPTIKLNPGWWFRIPALPFRINLIEGVN